MKEQTFQIRTPDGDMETFLAMPDGDGPYPPVILYMDIWGMRELDDGCLALYMADFSDIIGV